MICLSYFLPSYHISHGPLSITPSSFQEKHISRVPNLILAITLLSWEKRYKSGTKDLVIETSRTVIKGVTNLLGNSWTRCWSFSFIWRFCCFQIRKFHIRHVKSQNLLPIWMPNIRIIWDVGQQKRLFCSSLLTSLVLNISLALPPGFIDEFCKGVFPGIHFHNSNTGNDFIHKTNAVRREG